MIVRQEKKHPKFRVSFIFLIIVLSFAGCFLYYMKNDSKTEIIESDDASEAIAYITSVSNDTATEKQSQSAIINPIPQNDAAESKHRIDSVFIGDSIFNELSGFGLISANNIITGENVQLSDINTAEIDIDGKKVSYSDALMNMTGSSIYIMLGTDGIDSMTNDALLNEYSIFLKSVISSNPDKTIYIVSIPPVTSDKENDRTNPILNTAVDSYNLGLLTLADENGVCYLDLNTALKGSDGRLSPEFADDDGVLLNESGCNIVIDYILTHTYKK